MKTKLFLIGAAVAALAPLSGAQANHCGEIFIQSELGVVSNIDPGTVGCTLASSDEGMNTNVIVPGSGRLWVSYTGADLPIDGFSTIEMSGIAAVSPSCVAGACPLTFGYAGAAYLSQAVQVSRTTTTSGGTATARLCFAVSDGVCTQSQTQVYRTLN